MIAPHFATQISANFCICTLYVRIHNSVQYAASAFLIFFSFATNSLTHTSIHDFIHGETASAFAMVRTGYIDAHLIAIARKFIVGAFINIWKLRYRKWIERMKKKRLNSVIRVFICVSKTSGNAKWYDFVLLIEQADLLLIIGLSIFITEINEIMCTYRRICRDIVWILWRRIIDWRVCERNDCKLNLNSQVDFFIVFKGGNSRCSPLLLYTFETTWRIDAVFLLATFLASQWRFAFVDIYNGCKWDRSRNSCVHIGWFELLYFIVDSNYLELFWLATYFGTAHWFKYMNHKHIKYHQVQHPSSKHWNIHPALCAMIEIPRHLAVSELYWNPGAHLPDNFGWHTKPLLKFMHTWLISLQLWVFSEHSLISVE